MLNEYAEQWSKEIRKDYEEASNRRGYFPMVVDWYCYRILDEQRGAEHRHNPYWRNAEGQKQYNEEMTHTNLSSALIEHLKRIMQDTNKYSSPQRLDDIYEKLLPAIAAVCSEKQVVFIKNAAPTWQGDTDRDCWHGWRLAMSITKCRFQAEKPEVAAH